MAKRISLLLTSSPAALLSATLLAAALTQRLHVAALARDRRTPPSPALLGPTAARLALATVGAASAHQTLLPEVLECFVSRPAPAVTLGIGLVTLAFAYGQVAADLPRQRRAWAGRVCTLLGSTGLLAALLQPEMHPGLLMQSLAWTLFHPTASLTFGGTPRLLLWPPWLLLLLSTLLLALALGLVPVGATQPATRLLGAALVGASGGLCLCGSLLPLERALFLLHAVAGATGVLLVLACLDRSSVPSLPASGVGPLLALHLGSAPVGFLLIGHILSGSRMASSFGALAAYRAVWLSLHAGTNS